MAWLMHGDCLEQLRFIPSGSVDAVVTDPPYGLSFMGKKWDYDVPAVEVWAECLRVLKPGGHLLAFAGTRTQHRMAVRIEDAGFEIRDMIAWVYGSGFPKSLDVSKAIDKAAGAEREVVGVAGKSGSARNSMAGDFTGGEYMTTAPATDAAREWQGWGTALKPALEPITMARKPLAGTVAENVQSHRTGALNIDGCRVEGEKWPQAGQKDGGETLHAYGDGLNNSGRSGAHDAGRWPANLIHDGGPEVLAGFPGENARFFYCPKASKADRNAGCDDLEAGYPASAEFRPKHMDKAMDGADGNPYGRWSKVKNNHPTVKPTELMRYLCRLVTPPGGLVLDPFMGSGSTGRAAGLEGFDFIGIERDEAYFEIAKRRVG